MGLESFPENQLLANISDFEVFGISITRTSKSEEALLRHIAAASAKVLGVLAGAVYLPLISWGDDIREAVCVMAAFKARIAEGADPLDTEFAQLKTRAELTEVWLDSLRGQKRDRLKIALVGLVDSYDSENDSQQGRRRWVFGYSRNMTTDYS